MTMTAQSPQNTPHWPRVAAVFGASGGIGRALCEALIAGGTQTVYAGSRRGEGPDLPGIQPFAFDLKDEASIAGAAEAMRADPPEWIIVATGVLTLADGTGPERTYKRLDAGTMAEVLALNTIGPALIAKHTLAIMPRGRPFTFAALSARVGSISDNRLGGWHSYRASKAALNMLIRNFALEMARTHPESMIVGLHPGQSKARCLRRSSRALPMASSPRRRTPQPICSAFWRGLRLSNRGGCSISGATKSPRDAAFLHRAHG